MGDHLGEYSEVIWPFYKKKKKCRALFEAVHSIIANNLGNTVKVHVFEIFNYIKLPSKSFQIDIT